MLKMNLITQKELYWELYGELYWELCDELRRELCWEVYQPLGSQILTDFSHSKISRV
jgi:hypothetical protein